MKLLLICMMLAPAFGFAQSRAAAPARKKAQPKAQASPTIVNRSKIASLRVEGNHHYSQEQILAVAGLKPGETAGKPELDAAYNRLLATGAFDKVNYRFEVEPRTGAYTGVFTVQELEPVLPLRFERLGVGDRELTAMLASKDPLFLGSEVAANKPVIDRYRDWIRAYLQSKGLDSNIVGQTGPWGKDVAVIFRPEKPAPPVAQVTFEGNEAISQDALRSAIAGAAVGSPYTEEKFRQILDASVRPVYEAKGRVRVAFPQIRTEPASGVEGLHVFVRVAEGDVYKLGKVAFAEPVPPSPSELLKVGAFKSGEAGNFDRVNESVEKIRQALRRMGYLDAKIAATREVHDAEKSVALALHADTGARYSMGRLKVNGLDLNGEAAMRRLWGLKEGAPFNPEYPEKFVASVRGQGLFDNLGGIRQEVNLDEGSHTADVTLTFSGSGPKKNNDDAPAPPRR